MVNNTKAEDEDLKIDNLMLAEHLLMNEIYKGANMQSLVNLSSSLLNNPIAFGMLNLTELVYSEDFPQEAINDLINTRKQSTAAEKTKGTNLFRNAIRECRPIEQTWALMRSRFLVCGSKINGNLIGYITIPEIKNSLQDIDKDLVILISKIYAIAWHIKEEVHIKTSEQSLLWGLLTDSINKDYLYNNILYPVFGDYKKYCMLWMIRTDLEGNSLNQEDVNELFNCLEDKWYIPFEDGYAILVGKYEEKQLDKLNNQAQEKKIVIGISDSFSTLTDIKRNFGNAQKAVYYSKILGILSGLVYFNSYKLFHLIFTAKEHLDLSEFTYNSIEVIEQYDAKNNTEYLTTLKAYFQYDQNLKEMATSLHIHKNTVIYRMKKLQEFFKIDFHNCIQMASLVCTLFIRYTEKNKECITVR